ncbi:metallophosphoesterase [Oceanobacillus sp. CF4.6]|uniref:metallophosphoesterase n=1 Tax=Oceanobacillus sp. CF4.6 TaxID=3373080 RepID=UPI003EE47E38
MRKVGGRILLGVLFIFIVLVVYTFWDNNRFKIVEQTIDIDHLPEQLEDFHILQITDLHEKQFGKNQSKLIHAINSIDYDAIVFTGDMLDNKDSTSYDSFYSLIEGIHKKENAWFVPGNTDPTSYHIDTAIEKSNFIIGMEERGVHLLESIQTVSIEGENIHFVNFELSIIKDPQYIGRVQGIVKADYSRDEKYHAYQEKLWEDLTVLDNLQASDVVIALNHFPIPDIRIDHIQNNSALIWRDFDLIMAGHYHGGQIRLPFIGALFVPEAWYEPNGFLPPKDRVNGIWEYGGVKQYVSTGLGSSDALSFIKFRLFNTPEINLLRFRRD